MQVLVRFSLLLPRLHVGRQTLFECDVVARTGERHEVWEQLYPPGGD